VVLILYNVVPILYNNVYAVLFPFYLAEKFLTPRCKHSNASLKSINKTNIRTNNSYIYINISFILINISLIYTFLCGLTNLVDLFRLIYILG
jgi:hypothetical protein